MIFFFLIFQIKPGWNSRSCGVNLSNILKGEPSGFVDGLDVDVKREKKGIKDNTDVFSLDTWKDEFTMD